MRLQEMDLVNGQDELLPRFCGVEFDIHGIVGIRVIDPAPKDTAGLMKQLGPYRASLDREPDVTIRFQKELFPSELSPRYFNPEGKSSFWKRMVTSGSRSRDAR